MTQFAIYETDADNEIEMGISDIKNNNFVSESEMNIFFKNWENKLTSTV